MGISYLGEVVEKAHFLTLEQILPGLPPVGQSARVELASLCDGEARRCLENPAVILKVLKDYSDALPKARVLRTDAEWVKIGRCLLEKGPARVLSKTELHYMHGKPLLNGAFGVTKPGKFTPSGSPVLRFIMDLRASNYIQVPIIGDIASLAGPGKWINIVLPKGQIMRVGGDDLLSAFYLFRLPTLRHLLLAFDKSLRHSDLFDSSEDTLSVFLAATRGGSQQSEYHSMLTDA